MIDIAHGIEPIGIERGNSRDQTDKGGAVIRGISEGERRARSLQRIASRLAAIRLSAVGGWKDGCLRSVLRGSGVRERKSSQAKQGRSKKEKTNNSSNNPLPGKRGKAAEDATRPRRRRSRLIVISGIAATRRSNIRVHCSRNVSTAFEPGSSKTAPRNVQF